MELVLGTAQILPGYGVLSGRVKRSRGVEFQKIIETSSHEGFAAIDTSPVYGDAEELIGASASSLPVHTKIRPGMIPEESVLRSLQSLRRNFVDVVYLHEELRMTEDQAKQLNYLDSVRGDLVGEVGASIYSEEEYQLALQVPEITVIQVPFNALDRRFGREALVGARDRGKRIVARSVFLQGLLLASPQALPPVVSHLAGAVNGFQELARRYQVSFVELAIAFVRGNSMFSQIVIGASGVSEVSQISRAFSSSSSTEALLELTSDTAPAWPATDPRTWT